MSELERRCMREAMYFLAGAIIGAALVHIALMAGVA